MKNNKFKLFILPVIVVIVLLVIQALCDLELPQYTSDIINNGIGQNGISRNVPEVLSEELYEGIVKISGEDAGIIASYDLMIKDNLSSKDLEKIAKDYPLINSRNIYVLKNLSDEKLDILEKKIVKPMIIATMFYTNNEMLVKNLNMPLQEGVNLLSWLMSLDKVTFNNIMENINGTLENLESSMLNSYGSNAIKTIYTEVGVDMEQYQMNYIYGKGAVMLLIAGLGMVIAIIVGYLVSKLAARISYFLRNAVVTKIMNFGLSEFKEFGSSSLITRSTNDIEQIKNFFVMLLRIVVFAPIMGIGAFMKVIDNPLNWLIAVALICIIVLISILFALALPKFKNMQKLIDKMNLVSREIITGMPVIRTFGTEKHEEERFDKANQRLTKTNLFVNRLMNIMMPSMMLVMNIISILIIWYGAKQIDIGTLQVGNLLAFITYTMQIIMSFLMISMVSVVLPRAMVSLKRVKQILDKDISIVTSDNAIPFDDSQKGILEFKNVSFKYPDADEAMLKNISFKCDKGTTTAFIGSTGSGKSTLVNLIPRFFDVTDGEIIFDGVNIKDADIKELREKIGYVPQKGVLFTGTIESNLKLGNDNLTSKEIEECARVSESLEFIDKKEGKFQSDIAQGGTNVSGGQKQRLSIARAIAKNPEVYVFDDSFSALDFKTDANLRKNLKKHAKDATILIVAQRISTIMNADNIIVLNEGEVVGQGTHKELLKNCPIYKEIALSQLREEEL